MEGFVFGEWAIYLLFLVGLGGYLLLQFLLFRAYRRQENSRFSHLRALHNLVEEELKRSRLLAQHSNVFPIPSSIQDQLEIINLQIEALTKAEIKNRP